MRAHFAAARAQAADRRPEAQRGELPWPDGIMLPPAHCLCTPGGGPGLQRAQAAPAALARLLRGAAHRADARGALAGAQLPAAAHALRGLQDGCAPLQPPVQGLPGSVWAQGRGTVLLLNVHSPAAFLQGWRTISPWARRGGSWGTPPRSRGLTTSCAGFRRGATAGGRSSGLGRRGAPCYGWHCWWRWRCSSGCSCHCGGAVRRGCRGWRTTAPTYSN